MGEVQVVGPGWWTRRDGYCGWGIFADVLILVLVLVLVTVSVVARPGWRARPGNWVWWGKVVVSDGVVVGGCETARVVKRGRGW